MAKVQVAMALTIDGFLPPSNYCLIQWIKNNREGFTYWRERATIPLFPRYPLIDLILDKDNGNNTCVYFAEVTDIDGLELLQGLSLYRLIDEIILYRLPITRNENSHSPINFPSGDWSITKTKTYKNGICRTIYHRISG